MRWTDANLRWDPRDFNGLNDTFVERSQIWMPEIDLYYSKTEDVPKSWECQHCPVHLESSGAILRGYYFVYRWAIGSDVHLDA